MKDGERAGGDIGVRRTSGKKCRAEGGSGSNPLVVEFECSVCYGPLLDPVIGTLKGCPQWRGPEGVGRTPAGFVIGPPDGPY